MLPFFGFPGKEELLSIVCQTAMVPLSSVCSVFFPGVLVRAHCPFAREEEQSEFPLSRQLIEAEQEAGPILPKPRTKTEAGESGAQKNDLTLPLSEPVDSHLNTEGKGAGIRNKTYFLGPVMSFESEIALWGSSSDKATCRRLQPPAQRLWGLLIGGLQKPPGRGPWHPALGGPAAVGLGLGDPVCLSHSGIL